MKKETLIFILRSIEVAVLVSVLVLVPHITNIYVITGLSVSAAFLAGMVEDFIDKQILNK